MTSLGRGHSLSTQASGRCRSTTRWWSYPCQPLPFSPNVSYPDRDHQGVIMGEVEVLSLTFFKKIFWPFPPPQAFICGGSSIGLASRRPFLPHKGKSIEDDNNLLLYRALWSRGQFMRFTEKLPEMVPSDELLDLVLKVMTLLRVVVIIPIKTTVLWFVPLL